MSLRFLAVRWLLVSLLRRSDATAALETALALTVAFPLCFYGFEVCMMTYTEGVLSDAANLAVRYAVVHGTDSTSCSGPSTGCSDQAGANVEQVVTQDAQVALHDMTKMSVSVAYPDGASTPGSRVSVKVAYTYVPYMNYLGLAQKLGSTAEGVIVY